MRSNIENKADRGKRGKKRSASVTNEWERETRERENREHGADIKKCRNGDDERKTSCGERAVRVTRFRRNHEAAKRERHKQKDEKHSADETELFRIHSEDGIIHGFRQIIELLNALAEATAEKS